MLQSAELAFAQSIAATRKRQAELEVEIIDVKLRNLNADIEDTREQERLLEGEAASLGEVAESYLKIARTYADLLMRLIFLGVRALDVYTLSSNSNQLRYDSGYVSPDLEANVFWTLTRVRERHHATEVIDLMGALQESTTALGGQLAYAAQYINYRSLPGWQEDIIFRIEDSPDIIQQFKDTMQYRFSISLEEDEPSNAFESKLEAVTIGLIGARSPVNNIACNIEHSGEWSTRRSQNGEIVKITGSPKRSSLEQASITLEQFDARLGADIDRVLDNFWGRGPSTDWILYLDPERMERDQVDLSGLTEIRIAIHYRAIFRPT